MHRLDARSKFIILVFYSVGLFFIHSWVGLAIVAGALFLAIGIAQVSPKRIFAYVMPVYVLVSFTIIFNAFVYIAPGVEWEIVPQEYIELLLGDATQLPIAGTRMVGVCIPVVGDIAFSVQGALRGIYIALRILLLVWASLLFSYTTTSTQMTDALTRFLAPLRRLHVPVDDIAMVVSIALRFIPEVIDEFFAIRDAQWSRGAPFGEGNLIARLRAHCAILIPLVVSMFRRADHLAQAMDVRCYGMPGVSRTMPRLAALSPAQWGATIGICALLVILAIVL